MSGPLSLPARVAGLLRRNVIAVKDVGFDPLYPHAPEPGLSERPIALIDAGDSAP